MKNRPKILTWGACLILLAGLSLPLQIMVLYGHPPTEIAAIATKLSPLNWLILFFCPIVAALVYRASPLSIAAVPLLAGLVIYNNWFVGRIQTDYAPWATVAASLVFCSALAGIFTRDALKVLMNPRLRWWLTPERRAAEIPLRLRVLDGPYKSGKVEFFTTTCDISAGGAFIPYDAKHSASLPAAVHELRRSEGAVGRAEVFSVRNLTIGTQCYICLKLGELAFIHCRAEVVRINATPGGLYPPGVGIRFLGLSGQEKRLIVWFMEELDEEQADAAEIAARKQRDRIAA